MTQYSDIVSDGGMDPRNKLDTPPAAQRPWVGLTDEDRVEIYEEHRLQIRPIIEIVEAKLREKNT